MILSAKIGSYFGLAARTVNWFMVLSFAPQPVQPYMAKGRIVNNKHVKQLSADAPYFWSWMKMPLPPDPAADCKIIRRQYIVKAYADRGVKTIIAIDRDPNSNVRRKADGKTGAEIIRIACGLAPEGRCRWTLRLLEKQVRLELDEPVGRETIRHVKKTDSAPQE